MEGKREKQINWHLKLENRTIGMIKSLSNKFDHLFPSNENGVGSKRK